MRRLLLPGILGLAHGLADAAASFLLCVLPQQILSISYITGLILLYNILAFVYQPLAGMLADRFKNPRAAALIGLFLLIAALTALNHYPYLAVILAGIGSAAFHAGGGALAIQATPASAAGAGLFTAPGVVGLALGAALGLSGYNLTWLLLILLVIIALAIALPKIESDRAVQLSQTNFSQPTAALLIIVSAIALTAAVWTSLDFLLRGNIQVVILLAIAAAIGKVSGGICAEKWGWKLWAVGGLTLASILLIAGDRNIFTLLPSVALLQSTTPITLLATAQLMPKQPATAAGLALGLAVAIGGIPVVSGLGKITGTLPISALLVLAIALLLRHAFNDKLRRVR